jgi:hypothetical protein
LVSDKGLIPKHSLSEDNAVAEYNLEELVISRWLGLVGSEYRLLQESVRVTERGIVKFIDYHLPIETIRRDPVTVRTFSKVALAAFLGPLAVALFILAALPHKEPDLWTATAVWAGLSIAGLVAFFISFRNATVLLGEGVQVGFVPRRRTAGRIRQFIEEIHRAKLRLIERRIRNLSTILQVEEMFRRLSFYVDKRIISQSEMEDFTSALNEIKLQAT